MLLSEDNGFAPRIAMDKDGNAFVVWHEFDGIGAYAIWAARFDRHLEWQEPTVISSRPEQFGDDCTFPKIGFDDAGNAIAIWQKYDFHLNNSIVRANRYTRASGWGTDETISGASGVARDINLGVSPSGYATASWWAQKNNWLSPWSASFAPSP